MPFTGVPPIPTGLSPAVPSPSRAGELTASGESPYVRSQAVNRASVWMRALDLVRRGLLEPALTVVALVHFPR